MIALPVTSGSGWLTGRARRLLLALMVAPTVVLVLLLAWRPAWLQVRGLDALESVGSLVPAIGMIWASTRFRGARRPYWLGWALASAGFGVGQVIWSVYTVGMGVAVPFPSLADAAYLTVYPLALLATLWLMPRQSRTFDRLRLLGDVLTVTLSAAALLSVPVILPIVKGSDLTLLGRTLSLAYPIGDLLLLTAIILPVPIPGASRRWLVVGALLFLSADLHFALGANVGSYVLGAWFDPLWQVAQVCFCCALLADDGQTAPARRIGRNRVAAVLGPFFGLVLAGGAALVLVSRVSPEDGTVWALLFGLALCMVAAVRQWAYLAENGFLVEQALELNQTLEQRVAERTAELELSTRELAEANRLKGQFLATVSHELRTPMNAIIGYAQVLLDGLDGPLTEEQHQDVRQIIIGAERLLAHINEILDLSKMEAGRIVLAKERLDLSRIVDDVLDTIAPLAAQKGLMVATDVQDVPLLLADPQRVRQILLNLVANAVKFTDRGGVRIWARAAGNNVWISVQDTGVGIPPEAVAYIFDEFRQVDGSPSRRHGGTGLGLAIAKRLAELHGGTITCQSRPGAGSTFTFTMPVYGAGLDEELSPVEQVAAAMMDENRN